jgi:hypothetical protein
VVQGQPREEVHEIPSQPVAGHGGTLLSSQVRRWEADMDHGSRAAQAKKVGETPPISKKKKKNCL